jgi:uncharacterized protein
MEITRKIYKSLCSWHDSKERRPLLIRGARQVGKSHAVRSWARKQKLHLIEINLEEKSNFKSLFEPDLDPERILSEISALTGLNPRANDSLLFIDEIQAAPRAITALRYFYEKMPNVKVIAAGSLVEFILREEGFPVGRVDSLFLSPLSFTEFLAAICKQGLADYVTNYVIESHSVIPEPIHKELLLHLKDYYRVGGMPKVVSTFAETKDYAQVSKEQGLVVRGYKDDFAKYAKTADWSTLNAIIATIGTLVGRTRVVFNQVGQEFTSVQVRKAIGLLVEAQVLHTIYPCHTKTLPLAANENRKFYKLIFLDIGLLHYLLGFDWRSISGEEDLTDICDGRFAEQFVGQELIAHRSESVRYQLHYWDRPKKGSDAEVDYVIERNGLPVPLEVKSGVRGKLRSMRQYNLELSPKEAFVLSQRNSEKLENMALVPLYLA